ncbi:MAG: Ig-like domain-containing protein [Clostridia bacterium]|nr:Ig-like domain-containing protein [Clostridia bacterium]
MKKILTKAFAFLLCAVMLATCAPLDGFVFEAEAASFKVGDIVEFGRYPTMEIVNSYLKAKLAEQTPDSRGVIYYNGNYYMKTTIGSTLYYFSYDPIKWKVLSVDSDGVYLLAQRILDWQYYDISSPYSSIWADSTLRTWLNSTFYNRAFTDYEKTRINTTHLVNGDNPDYGTEGGIDTYDKIFIPSLSDALSTSYGFSNSYSSNTTRKATLTDYSAELINDYFGLSSSNGCKSGDYYPWWLRTPGGRSNDAYYVGSNGIVDDSIVNNFVGIRPALKLNPGSEIYKSKNYTTYAVKAVDETTGKPLAGVNVVFDGESVGSTDYTGVYNLKVGSDVDITKTVTFNRNGYTNETRALYELNQYSTSTVKMKSGFDLSNRLAGIALGEEKIYGPKVSVLGEEFYLFTTNVGLNLGALSFDYKQNAEDKTVKYIIGLGDGVNVESEGNFYKNYKDFKDFFVLSSNGTNWNNYNKIRDKLKKIDGDIGFSANLTVAGYMEFDYSSGDVVFKEGGMVVTAEVGVSQDVPFAYICYATFKIAGEVEGSLYLQKIDNGEISPGGSFGIKLKPTIGVGAKLLSKDVASVEAGIKGSIGGKVTLPASSLREAITADLSAGVYVKAKALWVFESEWSKTVNMNLYPNFGDIEVNSIDSIVEIDRNDFKPLSRDYLNTIRIETQSIDETVNNYSVYPYADPQLVELDDGRIVALWLGDNGTKSTMNLTTLYYSVYENGTWSTPAAVYESGLADNEPKICTDGEKVYALWQRGNEVFADDVSLDYMLENTDLVYSEFDGEWTEPVLVGNSGSGMYPISHNIATDNGNAAITWVEETESSMTVYTQQLVNGNWGTVNKAATLDNISSLAIGFVDGTATVAYSTDLDSNSETTGDSEVYIGSSRLTNDTVDDYGVTYQNGEFYYISGGYLATANTVSELYVGNNYSVLDNGTTIAVVYTVADGYKSELYVAYKETDGYSTPVALTSTGEHIADYSAIIDSENTIVAAMAVNNVDENATEYPYTSTDFIIDNIGQLADLEMDANVYYDPESVAAGEDVTFTATFKNVGTAAVNGYTLNLKNAEGEILATKVFENSIASGKTYQANIVYTLPDDFAKQTYTVEVVSDEDGNAENNSTAVEIGYADVQVLNTQVSNGVITATVANNGYGTAENVTVSLSQFSDSMVELGNVALGDIAAGEVKQYSYMLPASSLKFATPYSSNRLVVEAQSASDEVSVVNNTEETLISPKAVEGITLNTSTLSIDIGATQQLLATVAPSDAYNKVVHWVSDSTNIATVDEDGNVTAVAKGTAIITAITDDGNFVAQCQVTVNESVKGISMAEEEVDATVGNPIQLIVNIDPAGASNQKLYWDSLNENVAKVSDSGIVTGVKTGTTTITVTTDDGGFTASCKVNVTNPVRGVALNDTTMTIYNGTSKQLFATVTPLDADNPSLIWSSSDDTIVTVDENGVVTAGNSTGSAVITVRTVDGGYTATCTVKTGKKVTDVYISDSQVLLVPGLTHQLTATVMPLKALNRVVTWASTNEAVATVDQNGLITAHKAGTAVIIVETDDGNYSKTCTVTVDNSAQGFELTSHDEYIAVNGKVQLNGRFTPSDAQNKAVTWTTSDSAIASVDENGLVTGKKAGSVVITATTVDGGYRDYCIVRVVGITGNVTTNTVVDAENGYIFGLDVGLESITDYVELTDSSCSLEYDTLTGEVGTGSITNIVRNGTIVDSYTVIIYGDVNGDGWYDGEDAFLVNLIVNGLLTEDKLPGYMWTAADCNHDGVINEFDVELLMGAGLRKNDIDQNSAQAELVTQTAYIEYASLIDQSAGMYPDIAPIPDMDGIPEDTTIPETNETVEPDGPVSEDHMDFEVIFTNIFEFIKKILSLIFSFII